MQKRKTRSHRAKSGTKPHYSALLLPNSATNPERSIAEFIEAILQREISSIKSLPCARGGGLRSKTVGLFESFNFSDVLRYEKKDDLRIGTRIRVSLYGGYNPSFPLALSYNPSVTASRATFPYTGTARSGIYRSPKASPVQGEVGML